MSLDDMLKSMASKPPKRGDMVRDIVIETMATLREEMAKLKVDPEASSRQVTNVVQSINNTARLLARLEGALEITETMILRHPLTRKIADTIVETLEPWPDARKACLQAFENLKNG